MAKESKRQTAPVGTNSKTAKIPPIQLIVDHSDSFSRAQLIRNSVALGPEFSCKERGLALLKALSKAGVISKTELTLCQSAIKSALKFPAKGFYIDSCGADDSLHFHIYDGSGNRVQPECFSSFASIPGGFKCLVGLADLGVLNRLQIEELEHDLSKNNGLKVEMDFSEQIHFEQVLRSFNPLPEMLAIALSKLPASIRPKISLKFETIRGKESVSFEVNGEHRPPNFSKEHAVLDTLDGFRAHAIGWKELLDFMVQIAQSSLPETILEAKIADTDKTELN